MLRPSMQTLRHLDMVIYVDGLDTDPLAGIPFELEDMRKKNTIEIITITVQVLASGNFKRDDDWGRLDEVLARSGWFALKQVSLSIKLHLSRRNVELEVALRKLPEIQFPRLSTNKSFSFKFHVTTNFG